eukprot:gene8395-11664_t
MAAGRFAALCAAAAPGAAWRCSDATDPDAKCEHGECVHNQCSCSPRYAKSGNQACDACAAGYKDYPHVSAGPPPAATSKKPQYFAIGDSITIGQFPYVQKDLGGVAESTLVTRNAGPAPEGQKCISVWLGPDLSRWDVISYNFGAWDTARQAGMQNGGTPLPKYVD